MIRFALISLLLLASAATSAAEIPVPAAPTIAARSYLLVDFDSGRRLVDHQTDERVDPASITKLMTSYVLFLELANGDLSYDDEVRISDKAWRTEGSRSFVEVNTSVRVEDLLRGMIIQSGNDATVALAEHVAGSEDTFATLMNQYAQTLGMSGDALHQRHRTTPRRPLHDRQRHRQAGCSDHSRIPGVLPALRGEGIYVQQHPAAQPQQSAVARSGRRRTEDGPHGSRRLLSRVVCAPRRHAAHRSRDGC